MKYVFTVSTNNLEGLIMYVWNYSTEIFDFVEKLEGGKKLVLELKEQYIDTNVSTLVSVVATDSKNCSFTSTQLFTRAAGNCDFMITITIEENDDF